MIFLFQPRGGLASALLGAEAQGLAIDFTDMSMVIRDTGTPANAFSGDPNSKLTYSSPSTKWVLGSNGLYTSGTTLRTSYDGSGTALGCLIEEARTNRLTNSNDQSAAAWTKTVTTTADTIISPDGTQNGDTLSVAATGSFKYSNQLIALNNGTTYTVSFFAKQNTARWVWLLGETSADAFAYFDLQSIATGSNGGMTTSIVDVGNGWRRCVATFTKTSANASEEVGIGLSDANASTSATSGISAYVWGAQLEIGSFPTSPIVTIGSTVTRSADIVSIAPSLFPFSTTILSVFASGKYIDAAAGANDNALFYFHNGATMKAGVDRIATTNHLAYRDTAIAVDTLKVATTSFFKAAVATQAADLALVMNGGAPYTNAGAAAVGAATILRIGGRVDLVSDMNGYMKQFLYLPRRMSNAELQAVTT